MRQNYVKLSVFSLLSGIFLILFSTLVHAQQKIVRATYFPELKTMELLMGELINKDKKLPDGALEQLPSGILLIDAKNASSKKLAIYPSNIVARGMIIQITNLDLAVNSSTPRANSTSSEFNVCSQLVSVIVPFRPDLKKDIDSVSAKVESFEPNKNCPKPEVTPIPGIATLGTTEAKEAEVIITGAFTAAEGSSPVYAGDVSAEYDLVQPASPVHFAPFFTFKGSTSPKADPDQLRIGAKVYKRFYNHNSSIPLEFIRAETTGELEANTELTVKNILAKPTLQFYMQNIYLSSDTNPDENVETVIDRARLKIIPSIGVETGRNVRSPLPRNEKAIARVVGGIGLNLVFPKTPLKAIGFKTITWENSFTQRWFLKPEQSYKKDDNKNLQLLNFGRKPRPYFISKVSLGVNDFFAPSISYEYGDLPPLYERIKNKVTVGFTFGFRRGLKAP